MWEIGSFWTNEIKEHSVDDNLTQVCSQVEKNLNDIWNGQEILLNELQRKNINTILNKWEFPDDLEWYSLWTKEDAFNSIWIPEWSLKSKYWYIYMIKKDSIYWDYIQILSIDWGTIAEIRNWKLTSEETKTPIEDIVEIYNNFILSLWEDNSKCEKLEK